MSANQMLKAMGYTTSITGIRAFQRDYNRFAAQPLLLTGELSEDTHDALRVAIAAGEVFTSLRDREAG